MKIKRADIVNFESQLSERYGASTLICKLPKHEFQDGGLIDKLARNADYDSAQDFVSKKNEDGRLTLAESFDFFEQYDQP